MHVQAVGRLRYQMMNIQAELNDYQDALRKAGTDPVSLTTQAEALVGLPDPAFEQALNAFDTAADDHSYYVPALDADYGSLLLEALADRCPDPTRKQQLYRGARERAAKFASYASSGSEGLARMIDVERIERKLAGFNAGEGS
jgi:hypothetical protein